MMENLVEDVGKEFPVAAQRVKMVFGVHMPTLPALRKYAAIFVSFFFILPCGNTDVIWTCFTTQRIR